MPKFLVMLGKIFWRMMASATSCLVVSLSDSTILMFLVLSPKVHLDLSFSMWMFEWRIWWIRCRETPSCWPMAFMLSPLARSSEAILMESLSFIGAEL